MARPRVFLSSTFYDFVQAREDVDRFIRQYGFDCVRHEAGAIPYSIDVPLESSAYREIETCDIFVTIIGGRYGTESRSQAGQSITQNEIAKALEKNIPVYIFIENSVYVEYNTYIVNKDSTNVKYRFVDNPAIYAFIKGLYDLPQNNQIKGFSTVVEITEYLRDQWAGLFQRQLSHDRRIVEGDLVRELKSVATALKGLVDTLSHKEANRDDAVQAIIQVNHPIFRRLATLTRTPYRIFFLDRPEMVKWFKARNWQPADEGTYSSDSVDEWYHESYGWLEFKKSFFREGGTLIPYDQEDWDDDWISLTKAAPASSAVNSDAPF